MDLVDYSKVTSIKLQVDCVTLSSVYEYTYNNEIYQTRSKWHR